MKLRLEESKSKLPKTKAIRNEIKNKLSNNGANKKDNFNKIKLTKIDVNTNDNLNSILNTTNETGYSTLPMILYPFTGVTTSTIETESNKMETNAEQSLGTKRKRRSTKDPTETQTVSSNKRFKSKYSTFVNTAIATSSTLMNNDSSQPQNKTGTTITKKLNGWCDFFGLILINSLIPIQHLHLNN